MKGSVSLLAWESRMDISRHMHMAPCDMGASLVLLDAGVWQDPVVHSAL